MKIKITKATNKEIKKFDVKEWRESNIEYFGRQIKWTRKSFIFKAVEKGQTVGTIRAQYQGEIVFIRNIIVAKEKRRQGVGKKLITEVEKEAKRLGAHKVFLYTGKEWYTNKFYKKLGYKIAAILPKHHFKVDYVIYSKFI